MFNHPDFLPLVNYRPCKGREFFLTANLQPGLNGAHFFAAGYSLAKNSGNGGRK